MNLPIELPVGYVLVYGTGTTVSTSGVQIVGEDSPVRYGSVYQIWDGGAAFIYGGDNVMFKDDDIYCRLLYNNIPYTMIPARLVTKQTPLL